MPKEFMGSKRVPILIDPTNPGEDYQYLLSALYEKARKSHSSRSKINRIVTLEQSNVYEVQAIDPKTNVPVKAYVKLAQTVILGEKIRAGRRIPTRYIFNYRADAEKGKGNFGTGFEINADQKNNIGKLKKPNDHTHSQFVKVFDLRNPENTKKHIRREFNHLPYHRGKELIFDDKNKRAYIVMHKAPGKTLSSYIKPPKNLLDFLVESDNKDFSVSIQIAINLAKALKRLHDQGIVHCDIKPNNILIGEEVTIVDFGLVKKENEITSKLRGDRKYFAPEILNMFKTNHFDTSLQNKKSDIYALGICIEEIFSRFPNKNLINPFIELLKKSNPQERNLEAFIDGLEEYQLAVDLRQNRSRAKALNQAYLKAIETRDALANIAKDFTNETYPASIRQSIETALNTIADEGIAEFVKFLDVKAFKELTTRKDILDKLDSIFEKAKQVDIWQDRIDHLFKMLEHIDLDQYQDVVNEKLIDLYKQAQEFKSRIAKRERTIDGLDNLSKLIDKLKEFHNRVDEFTLGLTLSNSITIDPSQPTASQKKILDELYHQYYFQNHSTSIQVNYKNIVAIPDEANPPYSKLVRVKLTKPVILDVKKIGSEEKLRARVLAKSLSDPDLKRGSFGRVIPVVRGEGKKPQVVKVMQYGLGTTPQTVMQESNLIPKFLHPHAAILENANAFIVMKAFDMNLFEFLKNNKHLSIEDRLTISVNLFRALEYVHHHLGLIHRDIKPDNIMINPDTLEVVLVDWGSSRKINEDDGLLPGAYRYRAPEGFSHFEDEKSDVFSMTSVMGEVWNGVNNRAREELRLLQLHQNTGVDFQKVLRTYLPQTPVGFRNLLFGVDADNSFKLELSDLINLGLKPHGERPNTVQIKKEMEKIRRNYLAKKIDVQNRDAFTTASVAGSIDYQELQNLSGAAILSRSTWAKIKNIILTGLTKFPNDYNTLQPSASSDNKPENQALIDEFIVGTGIYALRGLGSTQIMKKIDHTFEEFQNSIDFIKENIELALFKMEKFEKNMNDKKLSDSQRQYNRLMFDYWKEYGDQLTHMLDKHQKRNATFDEIYELNQVYKRKIEGFIVDSHAHKKTILNKLIDQVKLLVEAIEIKNKQFDPASITKHKTLLGILNALIAKLEDKSSLDMEIDYLQEQIEAYEKKIKTDKSLTSVSTAVVLERLTQTQKSFSTTHDISVDIELQLAQKKILDALSDYAKKDLTAAKAKAGTRAKDIEELQAIVQTSTSVKNLYRRTDEKLSNIETGLFGRSSLRTKVREATHYTERHKHRPKT